MADRFTVELADQALLAALNRALQAVTEPREMLHDIGAALKANAELRWDAKVDPTGAPWAPRSTSDTAKMWNRRNYNGSEVAPGTLLQATNILRGTLGHNEGDDWVDIGTSRSVPGKSQPTWQVGFLHEFGTARMRRRGILTADPHAGTLGAQDQADLLEVVQRHLAAAFG